MPPRHTDGSAWRAVVTGLDVRQPLGLAGLHRLQPFTLEAFRLLPDAAIPDHQSLLVLARPLLDLLSGSPPEEAFDEDRRPLRAVQQPTEPFGVPSLADGVQVTAQFG